MKWKNKGHEFDEYASIFKPEQKVYIYGAGEIGKQVYGHLQFADCVKGFIDNNPDLAQYCGKPVQSFVSFMTDGPSDIIVVVAASQQNRYYMMNQLRMVGYQDGRNLFDSDSFLRFYIGIYAMYSWNKLYFTSISLTVTHRCNLKCKGCLTFVPLCDSPRDYDIEDFKNSLDLFFASVDYVGFLEIAGGETLLYPHINSLLKYIGEKYRDKVDKAYVTTNGTIVPTDELCEIIRTYSFVLNVDDYSTQINPALNKLDEIVHKLDMLQVRYHINRVDNWFDLAIDRTDNSELSESELVNYYVACQQEWPELYEGYVYQCAYSTYAARTGLMPPNENEAYDLRSCTEADKKILLEYSKGYSDKGYVELCKRCAGFWGINRNLIQPAQQIDVTR